MKNKADMLFRHMKNLKRYGIVYEFDTVKRKIGFTKDISVYDINQVKKYFERNEDKIPEEICERYRLIMGHEMDMSYPGLFTEWIQWLRINDNIEKKAILADKELVKDWAKEIIGEDHIIPTYGAWDHYDDINWDELPNEFVLKCNHGSGMNIVVKDKYKIDHDKARKKMEEWLKTEHAYYALEMHYKLIPHRIIAEKYINDLNGVLIDYKFHCFNGKPEFVQVIERGDDGHGHQLHYDMSWKNLGWTFEDYPPIRTEPKKPKCFEEMRDISAKLSKGFRYVRVDLYDIKGKTFLGEMTFTPRGGYYPYVGTWTIEKDKHLGGFV